VALKVPVNSKMAVSSIVNITIREATVVATTISAVTIVVEIEAETVVATTEVINVEATVTTKVETGLKDSHKVNSK